MLIQKFFSQINKYGFFLTVRKAFYYLSNLSRFNLTLTMLTLKKKIYGRDLIIKHNKHKFPYYGNGDRSEVLYHSKWNQFYKEELFKINEHISKGDVVIDVGGNLGFFTLILSELVGTTGKVYTFEPSPEIFERLNRTILINNLNNVESFMVGFGEEEGNTELYYNPSQSGLTSIVQKISSGTTLEEIKLTTLDKFSRKINKRISFIKIDTEGYESQVLLGGTSVLSKDKPTICIELSGQYIESSRAALKILKKFDYTGNGFHIDLREIPPGTNFIFKPNVYK